MKNAIFRPKMVIFDQKTGLNVLKLAFSPKFPTVVSDNRLFVTLWHELDLSMETRGAQFEGQNEPFWTFFEILKIFTCYFGQFRPKN